MPKRNEGYRPGVEAALREKICKTVFGIVAECRPDELGIDIFAMDEVARESGVSTGTLYNYLGSKDELIACVIEESFRDYLQKITQIAEADTPVVEKLRALCEASLIVPVETQKVLYILNVYRRPMPETQKVLASLSQNKHETITKIMRQGLQDGIFRDVPVQHLAQEFAHYSDICVEQRMYDEERFSAKDTAQTIVRLFINGAASPGTMRSTGTQLDNRRI